MRHLNPFRGTEFAALLLNAVFVGYAAQVEWRWANPLTVVLGPLVWGLFLVYGVYLVPARTGLGPRELIQAQIGRWAGGFVWWVLFPVWAVSWLEELTFVFRYTMHPWHEWFGEFTLDTQIAVTWPWVVLIGLAGLAPVERVTAPVKVALVVLLAAPFAYRQEWPEALGFLGSATCCGEIWGMQTLVLWVAPALFFAGRFQGRTVLDGLTGVALPLLVATVTGFVTLAGAAVTSNRILKTGDYFYAVAGGGKIGEVKLLLLAFTLLGAGRFATALLWERLGEWRRWWVVFPLSAAIAWNVPLWHWYRLDWQALSIPFVALAGVLAAGYLRRPAMKFDTTEQWMATSVWVISATFGVVTHWNDNTVPALAWLIGFVLTSGTLRVWPWKCRENQHDVVHNH